jgi:hypothetical protein
MTDKEIDRLWGIALHESVAAGEMFTRYRFAAFVAEAERKKCAELVEELTEDLFVARAIRART